MHLEVFALDVTTHTFEPCSRKILVYLLHCDPEPETHSSIFLRVSLPVTLGNQTEITKIKEMGNHKDSGNLTKLSMLQTPKQ